MIIKRTSEQKELLQFCIVACESLRNHMAIYVSVCMTVVVDSEENNVKTTISRSVYMFMLI